MTGHDSPTKSPPKGTPGRRTAPARKVPVTDTSSSLWTALPPAQSNEERESLIRQIIQARTSLWMLLSTEVSTWRELRTMVLDTQPAQMPALLERPGGDDRAAALSAIDRALTGKSARGLAAAARLVVPRHQTLLALIRKLGAQGLSTPDGVGPVTQRLARMENTLMSGSARLAAHLVRKAAGTCVTDTHEDLLQEALLGMQDAYRRLSEDTMQFSTSYAVTYAKHRIRDELTRQRGISRRSSSDDVAPQFISLSHVIEGTDDLTLEETLGLADSFDWAEIDAECDIVSLRRQLGELPTLQHQILRAAFQLDGQDPIAPSTIARALKVPVSEVIEQAHSAVDLLRRQLAA
ncbi:sigma-70 family RNA polymerase sigma factor [Sinimarinibacterium sp. CAU 1509]|uniref:sigma-70 family RNA polymerase sigma factor n=1 Tax=Sinimarinibacterium sp. CAU 1509 TaxID=2562283 RepID=UPI0010ACD2F2|nr:sigma-70 family RNA polymerase sigma factor [Sinimarinibacterium sp. CAU 1509]TJY57265.1 sigma-70 family RNA polymerase sigma factor [Sinimarinibacterium sp. CAU 1509]